MAQKIPNIIKQNILSKPGTAYSGPNLAAKVAAQILLRRGKPVSKPQLPKAARKTLNPMEQ